MMDFLGSTIGRKYLMGLTGLIWAGFVFGHMAGNMLIFISAEAYNIYGHGITSGNLIYVIETVLVAALVIHVSCAASLVLTNRTARTGRYAVQPEAQKAAALGSKTMAVQGSLILAFIIWHLITFKYGRIYTTTIGGVEMRDLAKLLIEVFQNPMYVAWYIFCLILLGFHLNHGVSSIFQSLGLLTDAHQKKIKIIGSLYAIVVAGGFISQPLYAFLMHR